jgi:hypothetical protein
MLSHASIKAHKPFVLLAEDFDFCRDETKNRYSDLTVVQKRITPNITPTSYTDSSLYI